MGDGNWKKFPIRCLLVGCNIDFGVMMSGEHEEAVDDDEDFFGTSIIEPPDINGLGRHFASK